MKNFKILLILAMFIIISPVMVKAENFTWPSTGYLGDWRYKSDNRIAGGHTGVDIWSTPSGDWIDNISGKSSAIYAAYTGKVVWEGSIGFVVYHSDSLYTNYWHIKDRKVSTNSLVDTNTLLGYQDYDVKVHLHITVSSSGSDAGNVDPSPYFGLQLNVNNPNVEPAGKYVARASCGSPNVLIQGNIITAPYICQASSSIVIQPETTINSSGSNEAKFFIQ